MAMTKKEKLAFEAALTACALRMTTEVLPDVSPPDCKSDPSGKLTNGWLPVGEEGYRPRVEQACSSCTSHGTGRWDKTTTQGSRHLFSTKLKALRALRHYIEMQCAKSLRRIDVWIEAEIEATQAGHADAPGGEVSYDPNIIHRGG